MLSFTLILLDVPANWNTDLDRSTKWLILTAYQTICVTENHIYCTLIFNLLESIWSIYEILIDSNTTGQSEPESNSNEGVLHIPLELQNWRLITGCSLVLFPGYLFVRSYLTPIQDDSEPILAPPTTRIDSKWYNCVHQWSGRPGFNTWSCHTKDFENGNWYLLA